MCTVSMLVKAAIIICTASGWIVVADLDVRLRKETENLRQQGALFRRDPVRRPVLQIRTERHFLAHPVRLLLALPELVGPGIAVDVVGAGRFEEADSAGADQDARVEVSQSGIH